MPNYECSLCNYNTNIRTHFTKHLSTKKHQNNLIKLNQNQGDENQTLIFPSKTLNCEFSDPQKSSIFTQKPSIDPQFHSISHNKFSCKHCGRKYSRKDNLKRHLDNGCKEKNNEIADLKEKIDILLNKEAVSSNTNTNSNNTNSHNTTNNTTNNIIIINNYGDEDTKYITSDYILNLLKYKPAKAIPELIKYTHFNKDYPENQNIKLTNKKEPFVKVLKNNKWELADRKDTINDLIDQKHSILNTVNKDDINENIINRINNFNTKYLEDDKDLIHKLYKDSELILLNNS